MTAYGTEQSFTDSKIIIENAYFRMHGWHLRSKSDPVFVVSPHAGRHGNVTMNLIKTGVDAGRPTFTFELKSATQATKDLSIEGLIKILKVCTDLLDGPIDLIGVCQGAWLGAIFASRFPDKVKRYVNFVGPINTRTGTENRIEEYMKKPGVVEFHQRVVDMNGGIQSGMLQWLSFSMLSPMQIYLGRFLDQFWNIMNGDEDKIEKWNKTESWYDDRQDLAGVWFMQCMDWHFKNNKLFLGDFPDMLGGHIDLENIRCPVFLFAGGADPITAVRQVTDMQFAVGSKDVTIRVFKDEGHTSSFVKPAPLKIFSDLFFK
ncbi:alpha/beta fold hydrolase [Candidatus Pacearchaeota archaeon]|nr:alpha/beta fold hydrolase [Candidatus Pacearchaeota archaeon]